MIVRCAVCGVRGRWEGDTVVCAEPDTTPAWCSTSPLRAHGPWLEDDDPALAGGRFAMDADLTVYWPWVRPCWEEAR